jgi:hypothetical protein
VPALFCVVVLVEALQKSEPIRNERHGQIVPVLWFALSLVASEVDFSGSFPVLVGTKIEALNDCSHLQRSYDRSQDIRKEEMSKADQSERGDDNVPHG